MQYTYKTKGVCSQQIIIDIEDDTVMNVRYIGGCSGNLQGIGALVRGMKIDDVIEKLENIRCGFKNTSCPAQLAQALKSIKDN